MSYAIFRNSTSHICLNIEATRLIRICTACKLVNVFLPILDGNTMISVSNKGCIHIYTNFSGKFNQRHTLRTKAFNIPCIPISFLLVASITVKKIKKKITYMTILCAMGIPCKIKRLPSRQVCLPWKSNNSP